jgi:thioredoxin-related protein
MKKFFILVLFSQALFSNEVVEITWEKSWSKALQTAQAENRPILMVITGEHCSACERYHDVTLEKDQIIDEVSKNFVATTYDKNYLPVKYRVSKGTPTTLFFTPSGKRLKHKIYGAINYKQLLPVLQAISGKFRKK